MDQKTDHAVVVVNPFVIYFGFTIAAIFLQRIFPIVFFSERISRMIGVFLIVVNFGFGLPALLSMMRERTSPNPGRSSTVLVLSGIYCISRNPMYLGLTLLFTGLLTYFQIYWGLLIIPLLVWLITTWVIIPEEKYLEEKFSAEYMHYKSKVRRWI